jgi:hypothetical protein
MTLEQALQAVEGNDWSLNTSGKYDVWECPGEMADGVPEWVVYDRGGRGWVSREIGWYYSAAIGMTTQTLCGWQMRWTQLTRHCKQLCGRNYEHTVIA